MKILRELNKPVNVYGKTEFYLAGGLETVIDGFGYQDEDGHIEWYEGYDPPPDNDFHLTTLYPYGNGCDLSELLNKHGEENANENQAND